jgi:hypothetical protein
MSCEDAENHSDYVSGVARSAPGGPGKGAVVSEAAKSTCDKAGDKAEDEEADDSSSEDGAGVDDAGAGPGIRQPRHR